MAVPQNVSLTRQKTANAIKILYPQERVEMLFKQKYPLLSMISKADEWEGSNYPINFNYAGASTGSTTAAAQSLRKASSFQTASITRARRYAVGWVDNEAVLASRSRRGAHVKYLENQVDATIYALQRMVAYGLYRSDGVLAEVASVSSNTVTFVNRSDAYIFSEGDVILFNTADDGSGTTRTNGAEDHEVTYVDHGTGSVTVTSLHGNVAAGDFVFMASAIAQVTGQTHITGLGGWNPLTAPATDGSDDFFGVDRGVSVAHLSGHRLNNTSLPIEDIVQELAYKISYTGQADTVLMNPIQFHKMSQSMSSRGYRLLDGEKAVHGYRRYAFATGPFDLEAFADPACPEDRVHVLERSAISLPHLGAMPAWMEDGDNRFSRADFSEGDLTIFGLRFLGNMACWKPGCLGVGALDPAY